MAPFAPFSWFRSGGSDASCRTGLSTKASLDEAVRDVVEQLGRPRGEADLALVFTSTGYATDLPRLLPMLRAKIRAKHWIGCTGGGVVGTRGDGSASELEQTPALSVTTLSLPTAISAKG